MIFLMIHPISGMIFLIVILRKNLSVVKINPTTFGQQKKKMIQSFFSLMEYQKLNPDQKLNLDLTGQ